MPENLFACTDEQAPSDSQMILGPALADMRPRDRQLLWLAHAEGYSHREIAEITGLATASIRLLLFRARRKIARLLQGAGMREGSMMMRSCTREAEVKALVERGQWPQACAPDLRDHVSTCRSCSELALVTAAFQRARNQAVGAAKIGSPGLLWWRAQLRRRNVAVERISKPILSAQIFALAVNLVVAAAVAVWQARHGVAWLTWLQAASAQFQFAMARLSLALRSLRFRSAAHS